MRSAALACAVLVAASGACGEALAQQAPPSSRPRVGLNVVVDPAARTVVGRVVLEIVNPTDRPLDALELWRYPARLARRSPALADHQFHWLYPDDFDGGGMDVRDVTVDGAPAEVAALDHPIAGAGTLLRVRPARPVPPGARARIEASFTTRVPRRYGGFGCYRARCTLAGGFYPMPVALDARGYDRSAPPARGDVDIEVAVVGAPPTRSSTGWQVLVGGAQEATPGTPGARGKARLVDAAWPTVLVTHDLHLRTLAHRGVEIAYLQGQREAPPPAPPGKAAGYLHDDRASLVLEAARDGLDAMASLGLDLRPGARVLLVEVPLRLEVAVAEGGVVLVSDQAHRILPAERFRKFHSFQIVRAIANRLFEERLAPRERSADLAWSPDVAASLLVDRYTRERFVRAEHAQQILRGASFIPAVDRILYAPQIPFAAAYFNTLDDPDPTRDALARFSNDRPRGRTLHEKLRDLLGDEAEARLVRRLWSGEPVREAAEDEWSRVRPAGDPRASLDWFFDQWLRPYPAVDYRFEVESSAREGDEWRHVIRVWKQGPDGRSDGDLPVEPVELRVTDWGGVAKTIRWDGRPEPSDESANRESHQTRLEVRTARRLRSVLLDPRGRLLQRDDRGNTDPRVDDRSPPAARFVYNNFGALFNFQTLALDLSLDFTLARLYDFKNSLRFLLFRSEAVQVGGVAAYTRSFGRKVTPARLSSAVSTTLRVSRLEPGFGRGDEAPLPGTRVSLGVGVGYDDRVFVWDPWRYTSARAGATYALTALDGGKVYQQGTLSAGASRLFSISPRHGAAVEIEGAITFGDLKVPSQALYAGGPSGLRGYESDELAGRWYLLGRAEYRHAFVKDLNLNFLHALYLRGISGAVYTEAAVVSPCESYVPTGKDVFLDVGYTLRLFTDFFGVSQSVFHVDLAVPTVRRARGCFLEPGAQPLDPSRRSPVGVSVYFGAPW